MVYRFLSKLKTGLVYDPPIPLLGIYLEKITIWKDTRTPVFIAALFTKARMWKVKVKSLSHVQLCDPMDCSLPGFSIHGIFQARVPEWVAISFSGDLSDPGIKPGSPTLQADAWPSKPPGKHQDMEATYMSSDRRLDEDVVHIYNGILLSHGKEWNNAICSDMDEPRECHTKWSKSDRESQVSHDIAYLQNLKKWYKWTYFQNRNSHSCRRQTYSYQRRRWGGMIERLELTYTPCCYCC